MSGFTAMMDYIPDLLPPQRLVLNCVLNNNSKKTVCHRVHIGQVSTHSIKNSIIFIEKPGFEDLPADRQYIIKPLPEAAKKRPSGA